MTLLSPSRIRAFSNENLGTDLCLFFSRPNAVLHVERYSTLAIISPFSVKAIVSYKLAINLTWRGTSEKPSIRNFAVFSIIKDVCHSKFQNSTDFQINKIVQQHFLHARDRVLKWKHSNENTRGNLRLSN
ncbi:uncharacterized protein LOC118743931 [Rhagoletis pomonella]|uniref:uncharacterized protein LOC118743931 n=1 Tax=Rhagoletis pomonella TaxID=28610 RepID=UPI00177E8C54|nr:uncharacterized protein LOC118743931 [Rhagoletis pomonella]